MSLNITVAATEIYVNAGVAALSSEHRRRPENGMQGFPWWKRCFRITPQLILTRVLITHCGISRLSAGSDARLMLLMHEYVATLLLAIEVLIGLFSV